MIKKCYQHMNVNMSLFCDRKFNLFKILQQLKCIGYQKFGPIMKLPLPNCSFLGAKQHL